MEQFELTFRFENEDNSLTRFNGLSIEELGKFLRALSSAIVSGPEDKMVLSNIKGNCYAAVLSTKSKIQYESVKILHAEIAQRNFKGLNIQQRTYYRTLMGIIKNGLMLNVYDQNKEFYKTIDVSTEVKFFPFFYETNSYKGFLTRIGSRNLNTKNTIFISSSTTEIEISSEQERELISYYKKIELEFYVTEKINKETGKVEMATLDGFVVLATENHLAFSEAVSAVREKFGEYFAESNNFDETDQ